jgi:glycosyltransferase involved in cell wall biosynthesis
MATLLQVLPALDKGGVERGTVDLAKFLVREGHRAMVASEGGSLVPELEEAGGVHVTLPLATKNPLGIIRNVSRLASVIRENSVELVHARSRAPAWSARWAAERTHTPFVTTFHAVYNGYQNRPKRRYNSVMAAGRRVIAISDYVAEHVRQVYQVSPERLRTIYRGVDTDQFDPSSVPAERVEALRAQFGLDPGMKVVSLPGRITRIKGHLLLLDALARLSRTDFLVAFIGPDTPGSSYSRELHEQVEASPLKDRVRFTGPCHDMPAAVALSDLVAVPSIGPEAFGRVSVEAQAMGKPVAVTDVGGLGETLMVGATGWLVQPDDPAGLAEAVDLALSMPAEARLRLAERARSWVLDHFTAERMCRQTLDVYGDVLGGAG